MPAGFREHVVARNKGALQGNCWIDHDVFIETPDEIAPVMRKALKHEGPIIAGFHVAYSDKFFEMVKEETLHFNYLKSCGSRHTRKAESVTSKLSVM